MRTIELDAKGWHVVLDFYRALRLAIGAPDWHGWNINAFIDSMIWGDINAIEAPYTIRISGTARVDPALKAEIEEFAKVINDHAARHRGLEVTIEVCP
jgi:hypothetical protein